MCYDSNPPKVINYTKVFIARFFFSQLVVCVDVVRASVTPWHQAFGVKVWMSHRRLAATMRLCLAASAVRLRRDAQSFLSSITSALPRQHSQCFFVFFCCVCVFGAVMFLIEWCSNILKRQTVFHLRRQTVFHLRRQNVFHSFCMFFI